MAYTGEEEKRRAITVRLSVRVPAVRQSQVDCVQNVKITEQSVVSYFFELAAFLFRGVHGKGKAELENDYDIWLVKENSELILHPKREVFQYNIQKDDAVELRHKALPIMLNINLWEGQEKSMKVYSGSPVMDIIPTLCSELGIEEDSELSLAYPVIKVKEHTPCLRWLDPGTSLNSQGIADGDTLLLRKKFFIFNDDITEALERNSTLKELLYQQAYQHHISENCHLYDKDLSSIYTQLSVLFGHIEDNSGDFSTSSNTIEKLPKWAQRADHIDQLLEVRTLRQSVQAMPKGTAKSTVLQLTTEPSVTVVTYFPVRLQDSSDELVLAVSSDSVSICEVNEAGQLKIIPDKSWRLKDIRESCQQTEQTIRINTLGYWQELFTEYAAELSNYISESERISKRKALKQRSSVYVTSAEVSALPEHSTDEIAPQSSNTNALGSTPTGASPIKSDNAVLPSNSSRDSNVAASNISIASAQSQSAEDGSVCHWQAVVSNVSIPMDAASNGSVSVEAVSHGSVSLDMDASGSLSPDILQNSGSPCHGNLTSSSCAQSIASMSMAMPMDANGTNPINLKADATIIASHCENPQDTMVSSSVVKNAPQPRKSLEVEPQSDMQTKYQWPSAEEKSPSFSTHKRPFNVIFSPLKHTETVKQHHSRKGSQLSRTESIKSKTSQKSSLEYIFIPQYLSLDFRKILERHRLFHVVFMKQDIRPLLLDITAPVKQNIEVICGTFGISNPENFYLAIPPGIQTIVEKYGGRPKSIVGRFKKSEHSMKNFASRLHGSNTLESQYDHSIQPYLLHLRKFQHEEEDIDSPDVIFDNCGEEWPKSEHFDVARYRKFYQGWIGVVQGVYPVTRERAVQLAAHLTGVFFEKKSGKPWPPRDYDPKDFLPERYRNGPGIASEVIEAYKAIEGIQVLDCINKVIDLCSVHQGVFFEVATPVSGDMIPTKKMKKILLGISHGGLYSVEKETGMIKTKRDLCQIHNWACSDNSFHLDFRLWGDPIYGYTYQTKEVIDTLKMYLDIAKRRKIMEEFELERTREELERLGHLSDEEKKIDLSLPSGSEHMALQPLNGALENANGPVKVTEEKKIDPVLIQAANDGQCGKRMSNLSTLSPLEMEMDLSPLQV